MAHGATHDVREYYEVNTEAFRKLGHGRATGAIRRAVWAPGVQSRSEAFRYVDERIAGELRATVERLGLAAPPRVLDFGCGLGASLIALAEHSPIDGLGITLSPLQAQLASERILASGLRSQLQCVEGDFLHAAVGGGHAQLVLSIEAFVHSPTPGAFFDAAAAQLAPGGSLVVCDDFECEPGARARTPREQRWLREFRHGWVAASVVPFSEANAAAERAGLVLQTSEVWNPYLELSRPRDRLLALFLALARPLRPGGHRFRSWLGGHALQRGLSTGLIEYRYCVWRKPGPEPRAR